MMTKPNTRIDWTMARTAYINSLKELKDIAAEFGVSLAATEKHSQREKWGEQRKAIQEDAARKAQKSLTGDRAKQLADFSADNLLIAKAISNQVKANLNESAAAKVALPPEKLRLLASTIESAQRIGRLAMGAAADTAPPVDPAETARKVREHLAEMRKATDGSAREMAKP